MNIEPIKINTPKGERLIGPGHKPFVIAEMSGNHNQSFDKAKKIIDAAVEAGVDAIKIQTYTPDTMTIDSDKEWFKVKVNKTWAGRTLYQLYDWAHTPWEWQEDLKKYAENRGVLLFSTPFDSTAVDFLEKLNVEIYKIASFETGDIPLLKKVGSTKKPVIISRGMTSLEDLDLAIKTLKESGCPQVAVLHCISSYPATAGQMNLATVPDIQERFNVISGLSDHSLTSTASLIAVGLGASIIEKHFTLYRSEGGPDAAFSLEPNEMKELVEAVKHPVSVDSFSDSSVYIGKPTYDLESKEAENVVFKRSIFVIKDIKKGDKISNQNIRIIRPGYGMAPKYYDSVLGKTVNRDVDRGTPLAKELINEI